MKQGLMMLSLIAAGLPLAACTNGPEREPDIRAPAATVVGAPENCIPTNRLRSTEAHDDYTIDFTMIDGTVYRNTLPGRCSGLGFENRFGYRTTTGQLCSVDTITVLRNGGGPGPTCGLNSFVPVKLAPTTDKATATGNGAG